VDADRDDNPLSLDVPDEARRLREALHRANFDAAHIAALLGVQPAELRATALAATGKDRVLALRHAAGDAPLNTLARLFMLGVPVQLAAACCEPETEQTAVPAAKCC